MRVGTWLAVGALSMVGVGDAVDAVTMERAAPAAAPSLPASDAVLGAAAHLRESAQRGANGSLVIANERYRAVFSPRDGVVYTPRVGGRLEPRLAWSFRARALATATTTRTLDSVAPGISATGEHVVDFARPGLVERYEGERTGVEQIFVLSERPDGRGDVRITGDVTFAGRMTAAGGGLRFEAPGLPAFTYAAPVAFDADGTSIAVRVEAQASTLALVVDGAALDAARWPVTIDPLLGVTEVDDTDDTTSGVDVAYNARRGEFLVVYDAADPFDPDKTDIRLRRYHEDGDPVAAAAVIAENVGQAISHARIACDEIVDRCLVVWQRDGVVSSIRAQLLYGNGAATGTPFDPGPYFVNGFNPTNARYPRVFARNGRAHTLSETCFLVTWSEHINNYGVHSYYSQFGRVSGTGAVLGESQVSAPSTAAVEAAYDPYHDRYVAVWKVSGAIAARSIVGATGAVGSSIQVTTETVTGGPYITFDHASRRYLVAFRATSGGEGMRGQFLTAGQTPQAEGGTIWLTAFGDAPMDALLLGVRAQNGTFLTSYTRYYESSAEQRLSRVDQAGTSLNEAVLATGTNPTFYRYSAVGNGGYHVTVGADSQSVKLLNRGRWATGMVHGDANDFDGDGKGDLYVYRPSTGQFFVRKSSISSGSVLPQSVSFSLGGEGRVPVVLDWDGDGLADIGVFWLTSGQWTIRLSSTGTTETIALGRGGDVLVPGDYLGGVGDEIAVFRPSTGEWMFKERGVAATTTVVWGMSGDQPVPADDDNDGKRELCVFRPSTGGWLRVELNMTGLQIKTHGQPGDTAFGGNFVGGVEADQAVFRHGTWLIRDGATGVVTTQTGYAKIPVVLDWNGDGILDFGSWSEISGMWRITASGGTTMLAYGQTGDIPAGGQ